MRTLISIFLLSCFQLAQGATTETIANMAIRMFQVDAQVLPVVQTGDLFSTFTLKHERNGDRLVLNIEEVKIGAMSRGFQVEVSSGMKDKYDWCPIVFGEAPARIVIFMDQNMMFFRVRGTILPFYMRQ